MLQRDYVDGIGVFGYFVAIFTEVVMWMATLGYLPEKFGTPILLFLWINLIFGLCLIKHLNDNT